jgi:hypothetical protein
MLEIFISSMHGSVLERQVDPSETGVRFIHCTGETPESVKSTSFWVTWDEPAAGKILGCVPFERRVLCITEPPEYKNYSILLPPHRYILSPFRIHPSALAPESVVIRVPPLINWHYGVDMRQDAPAPPMTLKELSAEPMPTKKKLMSMICSTIDTLPMHRQRILFMHTLRKLFADRIDFFGKGFAFIPDKRQGIYEYRYHICLENNFHKNFWTEKISDAFLGRAVPIYAGCPNITDYFPLQSVIAVDYRVPDQAVQTIASVLDGDAERDYAIRLPHLEEARSRLFMNYNTPTALLRLIRHIHSAPHCDDPDLLARIYLASD